MENSKGNLVNIDIVHEMKRAYLDYSMSVIVGRALPDVRDGLKPVHRRILYTMNDAGNTADKPYRKCAYTVGEVLGKFHPHGDASVYDALVRMAQSFSLRYPLIDGQGNFGSVDGDPPAAYRYTEARMSKLSNEMLTDINKETIDFTLNYDGRLKEPEVLPSRFPNLLVNGSMGIAVGMATNIPPHNLGEIVDAISYLIKNPEAELDELMQFIKGPDFPTAGIIMGYSGIRAAYSTGRGKIILRGKADIEEYKGRNRIVITEIPYGVNKARLIMSMSDLVKDKRIEGISDLRDESDKKGMAIIVELKRDANPQVVLNQLYSYTQLQDTFGVINLALVDGVPKVLSLKEMLVHYVKFQEEVIARRTEYDLKKARERAHILEGLMIAIDFIDEVIAIIRSSKTPAEAKSRLIERFNLSEAQAEAIAQMRLIQLTGLEREKIEEELAGLKERIAYFESVLSDKAKLLEIVDTELLEIKRKYADKRRTQIEMVSGEVDIEDLIPVEESVVTYTNIGYIKRQPVNEYRTQHRGGRGVTGMKQRDEDFVTEMFTCSSHDNILFITDKGRMFKLKCYQIPEGSKQARGMNIVNLLPLENDERIAEMIKCSDFDDDTKFVTIITKKGTIKKTPLSAYKNIRKSGIIAIGLNEGDELAGAKLTDGDSELIVATKNGMALRMSETGLRSMGRGAHGVRAIKLRGDDCVVGLARVREGATILLITNKGFGRRTEISDYRLQNRGGYGLTNYKVDDKRGYVCSIRVVDEDDDAIMISNNGIIIRIRVSDVRVMGRYAHGVRVMRLPEDAEVVAFTRAEHDDDAEVAEVEQPSEEDIKEAQLAEANEVIEPDEPIADDEENSGDEE